MKQKLIFILFCVLQACSYNQEKGAENNSPGQTTLSQPDAFITYDLIKNDTAAVCLKCHTGRTEPDFSTREDFAANMSDILSEVMSNQMPPPKKFASLTNCQKAILQKWFDLGSPETSSVTVNTLPECSQIKE